MNKIKFEMGVYPFLSNPKYELPQFILLRNKELNFTILVDTIYDNIFINNDAYTIWEEVTGSRDININDNIITKKININGKEYYEEKFYYCDIVWADIFGENMYDWVESAISIMYSKLHNIDQKTKKFIVTNGTPFYSDHIQIQEDPIEYNYNNKPFIYSLNMQRDYKYIEDVDKKLFLLYHILEDNIYIGTEAIQKMFELSNFKLSEAELKEILENGFDNGDNSRFKKYNINVFRLNKNQWLNQFHRHWNRTY